ncbi:unnamed protein product [Ixodes persulcatus]
MKRVAYLYARLLQTHPVKTQIVTAGTMMLTSDIIVQKLIERRTCIDVERSAGFFLLGLCYSGPYMRVWHVFADRWFGGGNVPSATLKRLLMDQLLVAPVYLVGFLGLRGVFQRLSWPEIKESVRTKYVEVLMTGYMIWPAAMTINFRFVPLNYRILFSGLVSLVWNSILSYKLNASKRPV